MHDASTPETNLAPLIPSWLGTFAAWCMGGMSPLQAALILATLAYTVLKFWRLWTAKGKTE